MPTEPISDETIDVGEAALATLGFTNILKGDCPRVGIEKSREIVGIGKRIDDLATDFVYDRIEGPIKMPRTMTYRQLLDRFTKPVTALEIEKLHGKFPPEATDVWLAFLSVFNNVYTHVAERLPVADFDAYLGPKRIKPTNDKEYDFYSMLWIVDDPLVVFKLMQQGALQPEQVTALLEFFPSLYSHMKGALLNALVARNMREASFVNLPPRADRGLATFKQQRIVPYGPNIHVTAPPPKPQPMISPKTSQKTVNNLATEGQKAQGV